jgi:hypothetical protein
MIYGLKKLNFFLNRIPVSISLFVFILMSSLVTVTGFPSVEAKDIVSLKVVESAGINQQDVNITFGQVFVPGAIPEGSILGVDMDGITLPLQIDPKAMHADGSLRHAVFTTTLPSIGKNTQKELTIFAEGSLLTGDAVTASQVLATGYDAVLSITMGIRTYSASARNLLKTDTTNTWLSGPLVTEWLVSAPLKDSNGNEHPHLSAYFAIRAYTGLSSIKTDVIIENNWTFVPNPQNYVYDVTVTVPGKGVVFSQNSVNHYRQARWRRIFWWGVEPQIHIEHDARYMMKTGAVPTYDSTLVVPDYRFDEMISRFEGGDGLMEIGYMEPYMPAGGGREEIAPLPRWTARYLISQDARAKKVMLGFSEQAGSWSVHYRDKNKGLPISIDDYPNLTIVGEPLIFPACGGDCSTYYEPDVSHQPSLSYVPYLVTGDYYHLEELQFWANWDLFYGPADFHGYSKGLVSWDQVRGQAWALRTLAHAAYATPDNHPLKSYFLEKLDNNIEYYNKNWLNWNPLGYIANQAWLQTDSWIATWMDDFLSWTFGHISALGFSKADAFAVYKAKFPVGRMTHPDMCWILASTYWPAIVTPYPITNASRPCSTWLEYHESIILSWEEWAFIPGQNIAGREQELINAGCNSNLMADILHQQTGEMIGYAYDPQGYPSNLQPALAVAVELGVENALLAWEIFDNRSVKPTHLAGEGGGYDHHPQWAIVPAKRSPVVKIDDIEQELPQDVNFYQIYPNPFNSATKIEFELDISRQVKITAYNLLGQKVETITDKIFPSGRNSLVWQPNHLPGGIYFLSMTSGEYTNTSKVLYIK